MARGQRQLIESTGKPNLEDEDRGHLVLRINTLTLLPSARILKATRFQDSLLSSARFVALYPHEMTVEITCFRLCGFRVRSMSIILIHRYAGIRELHPSFNSRSREVSNDELDAIIKN